MRRTHLARLPLAVSITLLATAGLVACASGGTRTAAAPRPVVLLVHGRGHDTPDSAALRRRWQGALQAGARAVAGAPLLDASDVRLVWYGDALDTDAPVRCSADETAQAGLSRRAADDDGLGAIMGIASGLLAAVSDLDTGGGSDAGELRRLAGDLRFFGDPRLRCAAERRLGAAIASAAREGRPVIVVAHSMGAIVAWSHLQRRSAADVAPVTRLVTVGSPVGSPIVRELVAGGASLALPRGVGSWVNVVDRRDPFAVPLSSTASGLGDAVRQSSTGDAHEMTGYLRDATTARAVVGAWCAAHRGRLPGECRAFGR